MATTHSGAQRIEALTPGDWLVDTNRSEVRFVSRIMYGLVPVRGRFERFGGQLHVPETGAASGELRVETASIETGKAKRDTHLRTDDFFDAGNRPHMTFTLDSLDIAADGAATFAGSLTIRDKVIPINAPVSVSASGDDLRLETEVTVSHADAGLRWSKPLGIHGTKANTTVALTLVREAA
jgi:polyisoprenoid-binding protein YceI